MSDLIPFADARQLTDRIKAAVEDTWQLIREAYTSRTWESLGYASWDEYCSVEFGTSRLRLPREERQDVVGSLREAGLSVRAIASATGISTRTVQKDMEEVWSSTTPPEDRPKIQGADGKSYAPTRPTPAKTWNHLPTPKASEGNTWYGGPEPTHAGAPLPAGQDQADREVARIEQQPRPEPEQVPDEDALLAAIERRRPGATAEVNRTRVRARWSRAMAGLADIPLQDPEAVGAVLSETELSLAAGVLADAQQWLAKTRSGRQGLRVVGGQQ